MTAYLPPSSGRLSPRTDPAWAAPADAFADTRAGLRMPASSPRSVDRSQSAAPLPADSSPPRTLLVEPARTVPPASSLRPPLRLRAKWAVCCRIFTPAQPLYPLTSLRDFISGAYTQWHFPLLQACHI